MAEIASPPVISPDPAKYALAAFQAIDTAARDRRRLRLQEEAMQQQAIERARAAKAQDFNQMMAQLKFDQEKMEFGVTAAQRDYANETARMNAGQRAELAGANLEMQQARLGLMQEAQDLRNQRAGAGNDALAGLLGPVSEGAGTVLAPSVAVEAVDVAVPATEIPGLVEYGQPAGPDTGVVSDLSSTPETAAQPEGLLFPGFASDGAQGAEGPAGAAAGPGGGEIEGLVEFGPEPPPAFSTIDPGFNRMMEEQGRIQQELRNAQMGAVEAQNQARAISTAITRANDPVLINRANQKLGELSRTFAGANADAQKAAATLKNLAPKTAKAEQIQALVQSLTPLDGILPPADMLAIQKSLENAPNLPPTAKPLQDLAILSDYAAIRQSSGAQFPSKGISTATEVVKAYRAANDEKLLAESAPAVAQLADLKSDLDLTRKGALVEDSSGNLVRQKPDKTTDPEGYKAWLKDADDLEKEIRRTEQRAAPFLAARERLKAALEADQVRPAAAPRPETVPPPAAPPAAAPASTPSVRFQGEVRPAAAGGNPVPDWWTAQKNLVAAGRGSDGRVRVPRLEEYDTEILTAAAKGDPVYRTDNGGISLSAEVAGVRPYTDRRTGTAAALLSRHLGFDPAEVAPGGDSRQNTGNRWSDVTYETIVQEAAKSELTRRGFWKDGKPVNTSRPSPPASDEMKKAQEELRNLRNK